MESLESMLKELGARVSRLFRHPIVAKRGAGFNAGREAFYAGRKLNPYSPAAPEHADWEAGRDDALIEERAHEAW